MGQLVSYGIVPHTLPPEDRVESAVALAGINHGLAMGKFELDLTDGELRFSTGIDVTGTRLDPVVLERMVDNALEMLDAYTPLLRRKIPLPDGGRLGLRGRPTAVPGSSAGGPRCSAHQHPDDREGCSLAR